ncbi:glycoside hydrolase family 88/105 protein [Paludibacter jiangxiensis]|uniref:Rhamnogalacturonyl hydrolase YesR n=1 Tax=Paludibacter jiangxiensis TaxID=681398 RepID=A0A161LHA2_9BACT|nr:glycoside hydrolase family 88 protein [Paludibacter jiangxiensis]GAT61476.1 rhamnogalacturonyl hydrolase YesR [Paludibacter jiangxiensis]
MKKKCIASLLLASFFVSLSFAQSLPSKKEVLQKMELANHYFMTKYADPSKPLVTDRVRPSNIWTRGVYYEGLMALYALNPKVEYLKYAIDWSEFHKWNLRGGIETRNADNHCCGQTYIDLYKLDKSKAERIVNIKASIDKMLATDKVDDWSWIDALQMAMPVYAELGVIYKDDRYFQRMYDMYMDTKLKQGGGLFNAKDNLWWRDKDFVAPYKEPNGEDCYWSRGNGWVVAALVRVMDIMPKDAVGYSEYRKTYMAMMKALLPLQRPDGFWNVSLHDATHFGGKETSGTSLFVYGMAWGVRHGWLDKKTYMPVIVKAWNAMAKEAVHADGLLGFVQGTGKEPKDGQPLSYTKIPDFEDYGLGCYLLAGSEVYKLAPAAKTKKR